MSTSKIYIRVANKAGYRSNAVLRGKEENAENWNVCLFSILSQWLFILTHSNLLHYPEIESYGILSHL